MHQFNSKSSADDVVAGRDLSNKTAIVTGANSGIGYETARALVSAGARVILACRSRDTGQQAAQRINRLYDTDRAEFAQLDLSNTKAFPEFIESLSADKIDILICNAGLVLTTYQRTSQGVESTMGVSHHGHFLICKLLMPRLLASGNPRVVMVSSTAHKSAKRLNFDNFPIRQAGYKGMQAYAQAKLANILMANQLHKLYADKGLSACSLHPGTLITTEIGRDSKAFSILMDLISPFTKNPNQGAATTLYCALESADVVGGKYFSDCQPAKMSAQAADPEVAQKLWDKTEVFCSTLNLEWKSAPA